MAMSQAGRRRLILAVVVLAGGVAAAGGYAFRQAQMRSNMERWLAEGTTAHDRGDYEATLANLNEFVSRDKTNTEALLDFADARRRIPAEGNRHLFQARDVTQTALALEPDSLRGRRMLMEVYREIGRATETYDAAERVLRLDPNDLEAHQTRLNVLVRLGRTDDAIAAAREMADAVPGDMQAQLEAFGAMGEAGADAEALGAFVASREEQFAGQLGLELMRIHLLFQQLRSTPASSPDLPALSAKFTEMIVRAAELPAGSEIEARNFLHYLGLISSMDSRYAEIASTTLARYMEDPALAEAMAAFAAERAWSWGDFDEAGRVALQGAGTIATAADRSLGWLAISGVDASAEALAELEARTTVRASTWAALAKANNLLESDDGSGALALLEGLGTTDDDARRVALYLTARAERKNGETARAAQSWEALLAETPSWLLARKHLAEAYFNLGRLQDASRVLFDDPSGPTADVELMLKIEIALDEAGLERTRRSGADGFQLASRMAALDSDNPLWAAMAARAALAVGRMDDAKKYTEQLLEGNIAEVPDAAVTLANRWDRVDPKAAEAIREALGRTASDPATVYNLAVADLVAGLPEAGLARLQLGLKSASDDDRFAWETVLAAYQDEADDPDAAEALFALSAQYPEKLAVQQSVLASDSVWESPDRIGAVVERLRAITGDGGYQWRLFDLKRQLTDLDSAEADALEKAAALQIKIAGLVREDPNNAEALMIAYSAAEIAGDTDRAADFLLRASNAAPWDSNLRFLLPDALVKAGRLAAATQQATSLATLALYDPSLIQRRANLLVRYGRSDLARADWERLAQLGDDTAAVRFASVLAAQGQTERADAMVAEVIEAGDPSDPARDAAAAYLARRGDIDRGLELLEGLPADGVVGKRNKLIARYLVENTPDLDAARRNEAMAAAADDPELWAAAAQGFMSLGRLDDAQRVMGLGLAEHPDSPSLRALQEAFAAVQSQNPAATLALVRATVSLIPKPEAAAIVGLLDRRLGGQLDDAGLIASLQEMIESAPGSDLVWRILVEARIVAMRNAQLAGRFDEVQRQNDQAVATLRDAMEALPGNTSIARFAALRLRELGRPEDALFAARQWAEWVGRPSFEVDQMIALLLAQLGRSREAMVVIEHWQDDIAADRIAQPGDAFLLAGIMGTSGNSAGAVELFEPIATGSPQGLALGIRLARSLDDAATARAWLDQLEPLVLSGNDPRTVTEFGDAWWWLAARTGEVSDARRTLAAMDRLLATPAGDQPRIRFIKAIGHEKLGQTAEAIEQYQAVVRQNPAYRDAWNNLAYALLTTGGDLAEALRCADQAVSLARSTDASASSLAAYLDTKAQILIALGRADEAVSVYREALATVPDWPVGIVGLAEAQYASGDPDKARHTVENLDGRDIPENLSTRVTALVEQLED